MTVVVAQIRGAVITMVADSGLSEGDIILPGYSKLWKPNKNLLMGFCGDWSAITRMRYGLVSEKAQETWHPSAKADPTRWLYTNIAANLTRLIPGGPNDFTMLVVTRGAIFEIDSKGAVSQHSRNFAAIGSGAPFAWGALHSGASAREAAKIATELSPHCMVPLSEETI